VGILCARSAALVVGFEFPIDVSPIHPPEGNACDVRILLFAIRKGSLFRSILAIENSEQGGANLTTDSTDDADLHGSEWSGEGGCSSKTSPRRRGEKRRIGTQPGAAVPHKFVRRKLLFGNDTKGRDGFVKMARFQLLHRTLSLLLRREEMGYSGTFRFNQEKKDFEPGKTLTTNDTDNTDLHGSEAGLEKEDLGRRA
jgi:hypothetical protein